MYYADDVIKKLKESRQIIVFGAGIVATEVANVITTAPYNMEISYFVVSSMNKSSDEKNPDKILNIPVITIDEAVRVIDKKAPIIAACVEANIKDILNTLNKYGFNNVYRFSFDSDLWSEVRGNYIKYMYEQKGKSFHILERELERIEMPDTAQKKAAVYCIHSPFDKKLSENTSEYSYEIPIQVGAALTPDIDICNIKDNSGENISHKNKEYCELTALYWIWKNAKEDYVGMCHYRRHFKLNEGALKKLPYSDVDVILTIPIVNYPSVRDIYARDHILNDWKIAKEAVIKLDPQFFKAFERLESGTYYYAYNMFMARKEIVDDYCEFLFPILEYCEEMCAEKRDNYQNRYIGFLAERLLSVYMFKHENDYKLAHVGKHFIDSIQ